MLSSKYNLVILLVSSYDSTSGLHSAFFPLYFFPTHLVLSIVISPPNGLHSMALFWQANERRKGRRRVGERKGNRVHSLKDISHFDMIALPSSRFTNTILPLSEPKAPTIILKLQYSHMKGVHTPIKQLQTCLKANTWHKYSNKRGIIIIIKSITTTVLQ